MHHLVEIAGRRWRLRPEPINLALPLDFDGEQPDAFGLPRACRTPYTAGDFVARVAQGASINCDLVTLAPHGNGTHTETAWHILHAPLPLDALQLAPLIPAALLTVEIMTLEASGESYTAGELGDRVVSARAIMQAWQALGAPAEFAQALALRCADEEGGQGARWSGQDPPYLTAEAMRVVRALGVQHLLIDVPSVDREQDQGLLECHRVFWELPPRALAPLAPLPADHPAIGRTITELIDAPAQQADAFGLLNLQIPRWRLDAAPSWPRLFLLEEIG
jgi:kynurenine formamidase